MNGNSIGFTPAPEPIDPLLRDPQQPNGIMPDRVFYATGVLLDAEDFQAEQLYHRSRLAQVLSYLHGSGTIVGLQVLPQPETPTPDQEEELVVEPGLAIDRLGRLIEVPRQACIRVKRWLQDQSQSSTGIHINDPPEGSPPETPSWIVADVFLRFILCERGKTPAFAAGPYDALDAVTPSRIRDGYELTLVPRPANDLALPVDPWAELSAIADLTQRRQKLHELIFKNWAGGTRRWDQSGLTSLPEHVVGQNTTALFLARVTLPVTRNEAGEPERTTVSITVDNDSRSFVYPTAALATWLGV